MIPLKSVSSSGVGEHGRKDADSAGGAGATAEAQTLRPVEPLPVDAYGRKAHSGWRSVREVCASVLRATLAERSGSSAAWARRLGVDRSIIARWTALEMVKAPELPDLMLMEREDLVRLLKALLREVTPVAIAKEDPIRDARELVRLSSEVTDDGHESMRDGVLDADERARLAALGERVIAIGERLVALRGGK